MQYSQFKPIEPTCLSQAQGQMQQIPTASNNCCQKTNYKEQCYYTTQGLFECPEKQTIRVDINMANQKSEEVYGYLERYHN